MKTPLLSRFFSALIACAALVSAAQAAPHGMLYARGAQPKSFAATASGGLLYYGGPVISHPKVYAVFWGAGVDPETQSMVGPFYTNMLDSTYMDWLKEYDTNVKAVDGRQGTNQTINRGTFAGSLTITPINASSSLTDADVQHELDAQIAAGKLPAASDDSLYMIYFPSGVSISLDNEASCSTFCAYHEGFKSKNNGASIFYGVMPVCGMGCGSLSVTSSHECMEAVTDPFPTPGTNPAYPQAWNTTKGDEIGDLCVEGSSTITGHGIVSDVQTEWDNASGACAPGPWRQSDSARLAATVPAMPPFPILDSLRAGISGVWAGR